MCNKCKSCDCFTENTLVTRMLEGGNTYEQVPITAIKMGDKVLSYNTKKDKLEFKKVKSSGLTRKHADIVEVAISSGDYKFYVKCTPDHRFYNPIKKIYEAPYEGMDVDVSTTKSTAAHLRKHQAAKITSVTYSGVADVYDIGLFGNHTFYAGEGQVLVHNQTI